jgi:hypothetical protein
MSEDMCADGLTSCELFAPPREGGAVCKALALLREAEPLARELEAMCSAEELAWLAMAVSVPLAAPLPTGTLLGAAGKAEDEALAALLWTPA